MSGPTLLAGAPAALAVQEIPADIALAVEASGGSVTPAQIRVLKATLCAKFSMEQLQLYLIICARKGIDPFTEAYGFPNDQGGLAFGLRIDGIRGLARRAARYSRKLELIFSPEDPKAIIGARCAILREGDAEWFVSEVLLKEYHKGGNWNVMPEVMIKKVAEATALRAAFPDALAGVFEIAEVEK